MLVLGGLSQERVGHYCDKFVMGIIAVRNMLWSGKSDQ